MTDCYVPRMRLRLWFTRANFKATRSQVSSLSVDPASADLLQVVCANSGEQASTGDLLLRLSSLLSQDEDQLSAENYAFKELTGVELRKGPIVSGLRPASADVVISGGEAGLAGSPFAGYRFGLLTVGMLANVLGGELPIEVVALRGATEESFEDILGIGLAEDRTTSFRAKFRVPSGISGTTVNVVWRAWLLGRGAGTIPALTMTIRQFTRPTTTPIDAPLTAEEVSHTLSVAGLGVYAANQYAEVQSDPIPCSPGDVVFFTIERAAAGGDGYDHEIHIINQYAAITEVT